MHQPTQAQRRVSFDEESIAQQRREAGVCYGTQRIDDPLTPYIYYSESVSRAEGTVATSAAGGAAPARISIAALQERLQPTSDRQAQASTAAVPPDSEEKADDEVPLPRSRLASAKDCATLHAEDAVRSRIRSVGYVSMDGSDKQTAEEPTLPRGGWLPGAAQFALALCGCYALDCTLHNRYCGFLFRCGCTFPWAGGASACNIHNPVGPKCPWCNVHNGSLSWLAPAITGNFNVALMVLSYCAVWGAQRLPAPPSRALAARAAAAVAAFLGWGFLMGVVFWRFDGTHYPCFLLWGRETECQLPV